MSTGYEQYRQTAVQTAPPEQLVIMLYDGAIRFLEQAKAALLQGEDASAPASRAQEIIVELASSLNHEVGGEIASNLARLYDFWLQWLIQAQVKRDTAKIDEVLVMVRELREAWGSIAQAKRLPAPAGGLGGQVPALNTIG